MRYSISKLAGSRRFNELLGLLLLAGAVLTILSLATYSYLDATWFNHQPEDRPFGNLVGRVGATLAELLLQLFGTTSLAIPLVLAYAGWKRLRSSSRKASYWVLLALAVLGLSLAAFLDLLFDPIAWGGEIFRPGGYVGLKVADGLRSLFNDVGASVVSALMIAGMIILATRVSIARLMESILKRGWSVVLATWRSLAGLIGLVGKRKEKSRPSISRKKPAAKNTAVPDTDRRPAITLNGRERTAPAAELRKSVGTASGTGVKRAASGKRQATLPMDGGGGGYMLPPLEMLNDPEPQKGEDEKALLERAELLTRKFREFSVDGSVVAIHPGPVVTTFEFRPDAGVKYSKITSLTDDLCLALKAESVRIDRMPGKSTVGIEVPNRLQEVIFPKELIASEKFRSSESKLTLALGKDIGGKVFVAELDQMPHLLIAGATGAGKSVGLNGMITSILYKATPEQVRFIMIDTKMIELGVYTEIPHLLVPVVTEPKKASTALKWAVREMELRYRMLASVGVRNISQFNTLLSKEPGHTMVNERTGEEMELERIPYIVIVIDEMADLMMVSSSDVEESVMRLAQMARAVGIHLILATQRPSVDVITGTIKANFPSRIAYRVSQRVDSRTIIDQQGAEQLLGKGDMLFLPPGSARLLRLHGGYVTEPELNRITTFLKKTAKPIYDDSVLKEPEEDRPGYENGDRDSRFIEAVELVLNEGQCSITLIQRRLRLGYARAARIVDTMEQAGIVGPADGSKPREVLASPEVLETLRAGD